jgi:hypothetical protein
MSLEKLKILLDGMSKDKRLSFLESFLIYMPMMNRGIWSDGEYSDVTKVDCFRWSNELCHRIWNIKGDLERDEDFDFSKRFISQLKFHADQSKVFATHLGGSINSLLFNMIDQ